MNKYIKILSVLICLLMLFSSITSCNDAETDGGSDTTAAVSKTESVESTAEATEETTSETRAEATESSEEVTETTESESVTTEATTEATTTVTEETTTESIEATTESIEATTETTELITETELVEDLISFVDYTRASRGFYDLKKNGTAALSFTIPEGQVKKLYLCLTDTYGYTACSINVDVYKFSGDYKKAINSEPIYSEYITSTPKTYTIEFEDGLIANGSYIVVVSYVEPEVEEGETAPDVHGKIIQDYFWYKVTIPEGYDAYEMKSYLGGDVNKKYAFCGGIVVEHYVGKPVTETETETEITETETESSEVEDNVAKVILLAGQSNATGATVGSYLSEYVTPEKYQELIDGYSNVKILYSSGTISGGKLSIPNKSVTFVDVKMGQGISSTRFGPELGLAEYLSENYPDETFYIIKYAIGSSGLRAHWNPLDESKAICLNEFDDLVYQGLVELEMMGLTPEIVGFLWMQGESDASSANAAYQYYTYQDALVKLIRENYAFYEADGGIAFIDAGVSEEGMWSTAYLVNEMKRRYALESDLNEYIDTNKEELTCLQENNDNAHYDSWSMLRLGQMYGEKLSSFLD